MVQGWRLRLSPAALLCLASICLALPGDDQIFARGKRAFASGDFSRAAFLLEQVQRGPNQCEASFYAGLARHRLKQIDAAIVALRIASECDARNPAPKLALAQCLLENHDENRAAAALEEVLRLEPRNREALRTLSSIYLRHELNERGVATLEKLVAIDGRDLQARADLAAAYAGTLNFDKAREQFEAALALSPEYVPALTGLGHVWLKSGDQEKAIALLSRAAERAPQAYEPRFLLGIAHNGQSRYQEAVDCLKQAVALGGADPEIDYHLARAYRGLGRDEESQKALARFSAVRTQMKDQDEARRQAARLVLEAKPLVESGDLSGAIPLVESAAGLDPSNAQITFQLAGLYFDAQRYDAAREAVSRAIKLAPSEWTYHYLSGLIEKREGRLAEARTSLETAVRLNQSAAEALNQLGDLAMRRNDFAEAVRTFGRAAELDPNDQSYRLNLSVARQALDAKRR
jgi:protein O-GlcNAc transferase